MKPRTPVDPADHWQWRTTRLNPQGEWFDLTAPSTLAVRSSPPEGGPEAEPNGFLLSSFDLLNGLDVADADAKSPADFDAWFPDSKV